MKHVGRIITECSHTLQMNGQSHFIFSKGSTSIIVALRHGRTSVQCCHNVPHELFYCACFYILIRVETFHLMNKQSTFFFL